MSAICLRRREFISTLGGAAAWPLAARAQQRGKAARIGFLGATTAAGIEYSLKRFRDGLRDLGYVEGQNIFIDFRWAEGNYARLAEFAAELVRLRVDMLVTFGTPGTLAAKQTTTTLPIVMVVSGDAVATGIITSLARPGGNVTGSTFFNPELSAKRFEVFKDAYPSASRIAVLFNPDNPVDAYLVQAMELATNSLKLELQLFKARRAGEIEGAISNARQAGADALAVTDDAVFSTVYERIAELATNNGLRAIGSDSLARAGGLIGYGVNLPDIFYRGAYFVDRILKGTKPGDLPVEQPTKFVLVLNGKTARTLGLEIPPTLIARADEVIE
jgi:putative ABC transport system substrate-binding protein